METNPDEMKKSGSRFQVARVETKEEQVRESQNENEAADQQNNKRRRKSEDLRKKSVDLPRIDTNIPDSGSDGKHSNGPESPSATFSLSGDSIRSRSSIDGYNKTNCVMNTVEALPCVDHYRNIFSATGGGNLRARPTLAELHEEMDDEELIRKGKGKETGVGTDRE
ncbi:solute carrier family 12 member 2, partial [Aplysia californica]